MQNLKFQAFRTRVLGFPKFYNLFAIFISKFGLTRQWIFSRFIPYTPGVSVLDLGCGPGTNAFMFDPNDYIGIDIDDSYISKAIKAYPRHNFRCIDFLKLDESNVDALNYDLILACGLLHHLDDVTAEKYLMKAYSLLNPGGYLITIDNCYHQNQSWIKQSIIKLDRGKHIRDKEELNSIIDRTPFNYHHAIIENLLLIPYTHLIYSCYKPV